MPGDAEETLLEGAVTLHSKDGVVEIRFADHDGRLEVRQVTFDRPASSDWLRSIPMARLAAWVNGPTSARIRSALEHGGELVPNGLTLDVSERWTGRRPSLRLPERRGRRLPDSFYSRVAELHGRLTADGSRRPAREIAEANGVPASTVHRWMKEAKARGLLATSQGGDDT